MAAATESEWTLVSPSLSSSSERSDDEGECNINPKYDQQRLHKAPPLTQIDSPTHEATQSLDSSVEDDEGFVLEGDDVKVHVEQDGWLQALMSIHDDAEASYGTSSATEGVADVLSLAHVSEYRNHGDDDDDDYMGAGAVDFSFSGQRDGSDAVDGAQGSPELREAVHFPRSGTDDGDIVGGALRRELEEADVKKKEDIHVINKVVAKHDGGCGDGNSQNIKCGDQLYSASCEKEGDSNVAVAAPDVDHDGQMNNIDVGSARMVDKSDDQQVQASLDNITRSSDVEQEELHEISMNEAASATADPDWQEQLAGEEKPATPFMRKEVHEMNRQHNVVIEDIVAAVIGVDHGRTEPLQLHHEPRLAAAPIKSDVDQLKLDTIVELAPCKLLEQQLDIDQAEATLIKECPENPQQLRQKEALELVNRPAQKLAEENLRDYLPLNQGCEALRRVRYYERLEAVKQELESWEELRKKQEAVVARIKAERQDEEETLASIVAQLEEERQAHVRVLQNKLRFYEGRNDLESWILINQSKAGQGHMISTDNITAEEMSKSSASLQTSYCMTAYTCEDQSRTRADHGSANILFRKAQGTAAASTEGKHVATNSAALSSSSNDNLGVPSSLMTRMMETLGRLLAAGCCDCLDGVADQRVESGAQRLLAQSL